MICDTLYIQLNHMKCQHIIMWTILCILCWSIIVCIYLPQVHADSAYHEPPTFACFSPKRPKNPKQAAFLPISGTCTGVFCLLFLLFLHHLSGERLIYSSTDGAAVPGRSATKWVGCSGPREQQPSDNPPRPQQQRLSEQHQFAPAGDGLRFLKQEFGTLRDGEDPANEYGEAPWG